MLHYDSDTELFPRYDIYKKEMHVMKVPQMLTALEYAKVQESIVHWKKDILDMFNAGWIIDGAAWRYGSVVLDLKDSSEFCPLCQMFLSVELVDGLTGGYNRATTNCDKCPYYKFYGVTCDSPTSYWDRWSKLRTRDTALQMIEGLQKILNYTDKKRNEEKKKMGMRKIVDRNEVSIDDIQDMCMGDVWIVGRSKPAHIKYMLIKVDTDYLGGGGWKLINPISSSYKQVSYSGTKAVSIKDAFELWSKDIDFFLIEDKATLQHWLFEEEQLQEVGM